MDTLALLQKYDRPVPRYTSYPTAVHFNQEIRQGKYKGLLQSLSANMPISLYIHIPFCHILCHYCGCNTKVANTYSPVKQYVQTLLKEIELAGKELPNKMPVSHLHFGGGSPNFLESDDLKAIMELLNKYFIFDKNAEIAMETDPRLLNKEKIETLSELGFTRISLGVQDFNQTVQKAVNRVQPFDKVKASVDNLRNHGIDKINFDLMIGLPLQTLDSVRQSVKQAISLDPDRLAIFAYAHVPWMKKHQKLLEKYPMPDGNLRYDMVGCVKETLEKSGYRAIGIDHFAREYDSIYQIYKQGKLRRNFQGYTNDQASTILGFGISSISMFEDVYVQNTIDAPTYRQVVENGEFPITRGRILNQEDIKRRNIIEQIMCGYEVDISKYPLEKKMLEELEKDEIVEIKDNHVKIADQGWAYARIAASCFDEYYQPQEGQHARAI